MPPILAEIEGEVLINANDKNDDVSDAKIVELFWNARGL